MKINLGSSDGTVSRYIQAKKEQVPRLMRTFGMEFYRQVTISTPVDTGRARYGWNCSVGNPDFIIPAKAPEGTGVSSGGGVFYTLDSGKAGRVFTQSAVTGESPIYISNAVNYITALNNGHSRQAPARFVELSFFNVVDKLFKLTLHNQ